MFALPKWINDVRKLLPTTGTKVLAQVDGVWTFLSSFAPSAHKSSHATGGGDALTPADIGATDNSHDHSGGDGAQIDYGSLSGVPSTFTPADHYQDASTVNVYTGNFSGNLSSADDTAQKALETLDALVTGGGGNPVDITSRTSDYPLKPGEVVYLDYVNANSVPLNVATQEGEYVIDIFSSDIPLTGSSGTELRPNNTTYANAFVLSGIHAANSSVGADTGTASVFGLGYGSCVKANLRLSNYTLRKILQTSTLNTWSGPTYCTYNLNVIWNDTTTPWDSLGTIVFPVAQSGRIIIRRII